MKTCLMIPVKDRAHILPSLFKALNNLDPQPDCYIFSENNSSDDSLKLIYEFCRDKPHKIIRLWFKEPNANEAVLTVRIAWVRDTLLAAARKFDADFSIFLDSDVLPVSTDLIARLTHWEKPIVGAFCLRVQGGGSERVPVTSISHGRVKPISPLAVQQVHEGWLRDIKNFRNGTLGSGLRRRGGVFGACVCLSKEVIQKRSLSYVPLLLLPDIKGPKSVIPEDSGFCIKARYFGFEIYQDLDAFVTHLPDYRTRDWGESPELQHALIQRNECDAMQQPKQAPLNF